MQPIAVYVHTPFCPSKCGYCDFNSYEMDGEIVERTVLATIEEIRRSPHQGRLAKTIFFGGGTPTFLAVEQLLRIFQAVVETHPPIENCEITSEANPGTVDSLKFHSMREAGFNRVSIGGQSFEASDLATLGRIHSAGEIELAVSRSRESGFENINLDLMFALPGQSLFAWRKNLSRAIGLGTEHLSLYCLTLEPNTAFYKMHLRGQLIVPDDECQATMYDLAVETAAEAGLRQYEISNFARAGFECRHNMEYWHNQEYVAYGPGAVARVSNVRWTHIKHPKAYCEAVESGGDLSCERDTLSADTLEDERIMLGIRLNEGLLAYGVNESAIASLAKRGWISQVNGRITLTPQGRHYCNEVIVALM